MLVLLPFELSWTLSMVCWIHSLCFLTSVSTPGSFIFFLFKTHLTAKYFHLTVTTLTRSPRCQSHQDEVVSLLLKDRTSRVSITRVLSRCPSTDGVLVISSLEVFTNCSVLIDGILNPSGTFLSRYLWQPDVLEYGWCTACDTSFPPADY